MSYVLLGQDLHDTADRVREWFRDQYGAKKFKSEQEVAPELPLRPTWQAILATGYTLCVNVQPTPFSPSLNEFVTLAASKSLPIKLWTAVPDGPQRDSFSADLRSARTLGVGVVQVSATGSVHEYHRAVPLSMFGLSRTNPKSVPKSRREVVKNAEDTFLDGSPDLGCQSICQDLELVSRQIAQATYDNGNWKVPQGSTPLPVRFFTKDAWATMLETMEHRLEFGKAPARNAGLSKQLIVQTRAFTDWRNSVSHKPKSLRELQERDAKLRTMFEATRNLVVDWYQVAKKLRIIT